VVADAVRDTTLLLHGNTMHFTRYSSISCVLKHTNSGFKFNITHE